uniref:Uncharacterized protein n=1 Tax=Podoviridae sp. ctIyI17 TaxID=2825241 RepID=A0A8S5U4E8_9CAUD|nr:MAG TPA: hypothetical protein [Podoviridae sp. ctIyI17]
MTEFDAHKWALTYIIVYGNDDFYGCILSC